MHDEDYRKNAKDSSKRAAMSGITIARSSIEYIKALEYYDQIENKTVEDIRAMARIYRSLGFNDVNRKRYKEAADNYSNGINQLNAVYLEEIYELDDPDYRLLTWLYTGLADTSFELHNAKAGSATLNDALKTFNCIKNKTAEDYREFAKTCMVIAQKDKNLDESSKIYNIALENYNQIGDKTVEEIRAIVGIYRSLGTNYFNQQKYEEAADYYSDGIEQIERVNSKELYSLADEDYRLLIWLFIDFSDTLFYLHYNDASSLAFNHAYISFMRVNNKSAEEKEIKGDAKEFRLYFEKALSSKEFRASLAYQNHDLILVNKKEDNEFVDRFETFDLEPMQEHDHQNAICSQVIEQHDESIDVLINGLTGICLEKPRLFPFILREPEDKDYRETAANYLKLTRQLSREGKINNICSAYKEAKIALNKIKCKEACDIEHLEIIETNLSEWHAQLKNANQGVVTSGIQAIQAKPSTSSITSSLSMTLFASSSSATITPAPSPSLEGEFAMDIYDEDGEWSEFVVSEVSARVTPLS
ncbi:MAG: hypothetical protein Q8M03_01190 [Legionella sp.]|nr:hypothetical protein [Legionella sp.]